MFKRTKGYAIGGKRKGMQNGGRAMKPKGMSIGGAMKSKGYKRGGKVGKS